MKKIIIYISILLGILFGVEALNAKMLLSINPITYYYTFKGAMLTTAICCVEALILYEPVRWLVDVKLNEAIKNFRNEE